MVSSILRQVLLGLAGVGAIVISFLLAENDPAPAIPPTTIPLPVTPFPPPVVTLKNRHDGEASCVAYVDGGAKMARCGDVANLYRTWVVLRLPGGYVKFMSDARPGIICLGVNDNGYVVGTWRCKDANGADVPNSAWLLESRPDGSFRLKNLFNENKNSPPCLEAANEKLHLNGCNDGDSQQWDLHGP